MTLLSSRSDRFSAEPRCRLSTPYRNPARSESSGAISCRDAPRAILFPACTKRAQPLARPFLMRLATISRHSSDGCGRECRVRAAGRLGRLQFRERSIYNRSVLTGRQAASGAPAKYGGPVTAELATQGSPTRPAPNRWARYRE